MVEMSTKCVKRGWKWVKLGENAISPMWKKHQTCCQTTMMPRVECFLAETARLGSANPPPPPGAPR